MNRPRVIAATLLILALLSPALRGDNAADAAKLLEQARQSERDKRYPDAIQTTKQAIQLDPNNPMYHGYMGWLGLISNDYAMGLQASTTAVRLANGKNDAFYLFMAGENAYYDQRACRRHAILQAKPSIART